MSARLGQTARRLYTNCYGCAWYAKMSVACHTHTQIHTLTHTEGISSLSGTRYLSFNAIDLCCLIRLDSFIILLCAHSHTRTLNTHSHTHSDRQRGGQTERQREPLTRQACQPIGPKSAVLIPLAQSQSRQQLPHSVSLSLPLLLLLLILLLLFATTSSSSSSGIAQHCLAQPWHQFLFLLFVSSPKS